MKQHYPEKSQRKSSQVERKLDANILYIHQSVSTVGTILRIAHHDKMGFVLGCKDSSLYTNHCNTSHSQSENNDLINRYKKLTPSDKILNQLVIKSMT